MPISVRCRSGRYAAGLLAGASAFALAAGASMAAGPDGEARGGLRAPIVWSAVVVPGPQIADSGEAGESGETGESGEGGEAGAFDDAAADERLAGNLLAMKGHLLTALELHEMGETDAAAPHFGHPRAEHLAGIAGLLDAFGLAALPDQLERLEAAAYGGTGDVESSWNEAVSTIDDGIDATVDDAGSPLSELAAVGLLVLRQAAHEYQEAIDGNAFALDHEYQDGRGFYRAVRAEFEQRAQAFRAHEPVKFAELMAALDAIGAAWPTPLPPASPPLAPEELNAAVARYEIAALAFR